MSMWGKGKGRGGTVPLPSSKAGSTISLPGMGTEAAVPRKDVKLLNPRNTLTPAGTNNLLILKVEEMIAALQSPILYREMVEDKWSPLDITGYTPASQVIVSEGVAKFINCPLGEIVGYEGGSLIVGEKAYPPGHALEIVSFDTSSEAAVYNPDGGFYTTDSPPRLTVLLRIDHYLKGDGFMSPYLLGFPQSHYKFGPTMIGLNCFIESWASDQGWYAAHCLGPYGLRFLQDREAEKEFWQQKVKSSESDSVTAQNAAFAKNASVKTGTVPTFNSSPHYSSSSPSACKVKSGTMQKKTTIILEKEEKGVKTKETKIEESLATATGSMTISDAMQEALQRGANYATMENMFIKGDLSTVMELKDPVQYLVETFSSK